MRSSLLYDIRRSLVRPITIALVVGLALVGAGLAYLMLIGFSALAPSYQYYLVYTTHANVSGRVIKSSYVGLLVSASGQAVGGARVLVDGEWYVTNASGYVQFKASSVTGPLVVDVNGVNYTAEPTGAAIVDVNLFSRSGELIAAGPPLIMNSTNSTAIAIYNVYYRQEPSFALAGGVANRTPLTYLGQIEAGEISTWRVKLALNEPLVYVYMNASNASFGDSGPSTGTAAVMEVEVSEPVTVTYQVLVPQLEVLQARAIAETTSFGVLAEFLPLAAFVVVNDLFARPRASGALDYVLSRPITKGQLYASRLLGGLTTMIIASVASVLIAGLMTSYALSVSVNAAALAYAALALTVDVLSFYSLLYLISVLTPNHYTASSITLYLVLYLFNLFGVAALITGSAWLNYLSPRSLFQSIMGLGGLSLSVGLFSPSIVQPLPLSGLTAASALWVLVPALIGLIIYRRQDSP